MQRQRAYTTMTVKPGWFNASSKTLTSKVMGAPALGWSFTSPILDKYDMAQRLRSRNSVALFLAEPEVCCAMVEAQHTITAADLRPMEQLLGGGVGILQFPVKSRIPSIMFMFNTYASVITDVVLVPTFDEVQHVGAELIKFTLAPGQALSLTERDVATWYVKLVAALGSYMRANPGVVEARDVPQNLAVTTPLGGLWAESRNDGMRKLSFAVRLPYTRVGHQRYYKHPRYVNMRWHYGSVKPSQVLGTAVTVSRKGMPLYPVRETRLKGEPVVVCD